MGIVFFSAIPYVIRVWQGVVKPNPASWLLWAFIGWTLYITYVSSGAKESSWAMLQAAINPTLIAILVFWRQKSVLKRFEKLENVCLVVGFSALIAWLVTRDNPSTAQYALLLAILADGCASIPTLVHHWRYPDDDRPFAWAMFGLAFVAGLLAIREPTLSNYILPSYFVLGSILITTPLVAYRLKRKIPLSEWI